MKLDHFGRPVCLGWGQTRPCNTAVHPGYTRCYRCDRPYDGEQLRWCEEQWAEQKRQLEEAQKRWAAEDAAARESYQP